MNNPDLRTNDGFNDMLLAVLAHDLRQPFASIIMMADMVSYTRRSFSAEDLQEVFHELRDTAAKSLDMLDGLLYWIKSRREGFTLQVQPLLLNDLINEANGLFRYDQEKKSITFINQVAERQLIYANKHMLQFITRNILSNATRYSPVGGRITINYMLAEDWITVSFNDEGMGMTSEQLGNLFKLQDTVCLAGGLVKDAGIALAICRDMIQMLGGRLWAESSPGRGATFYYALPLTIKEKDDE